MAKKEKKKKEPKRKLKYGMFSCVGYIYRMLWDSERWLAFTGMLTVPLALILAAIYLYLPTVIIKTLETADTLSFIALVIFGLLSAKLIFELANTLLQVAIENSEHHVLMHLMYMFSVKSRGLDWYLEYDPEVHKISERANRALSNNHSAGVHFPMDFANAFADVLKFLLFGSVISMLNPLIILLLAVGCAVNHFTGKWAQDKNWAERDVRNKIYKKAFYTASEISRDFKYAKDIRLYSMRDFLHEKFLGLCSENLVERKKVEKRNVIASIVNFLTVFVRDGAAYAFLIYKAVHGEVDASSFVLYFSAITSMSGLMGGLVGTLNRIREGAMQVSDFREFLDIKGKLNLGEGIPVPTAPFSIEFKNVSFKYPQGDKQILDNISFKIEAGEKIALVGLNGAGKTTLTMMMCGLLLPDEGEVLIDGHTLFEYNRDEMYALFGFVPQDYHLLPISIARNIACALSDDEIDREKLARCIELSGFEEKVASLKNGADTLLNRRINYDGVDLSGGEIQRLLLARLLYKNPLCIILDEPTAALDPIAEDRMYRRYNEMASHATSVFISHRLASTRFCDRIFLLDGAKFAEVGTHDELMAMGGRYRELFDIQSKYYREGEKTDEE